MTRKIIYITGTRADFGLMAETLRLMAADHNIALSICVTGTHLLADYGSTIQDIIAMNFNICAKIPVDLDGETSGLKICSALGKQVTEFAKLFHHEKPDAILILGDRGEMLMAATSALHMNIPIFHIHGGERSGTIDESIRHAISKIAHYHFVTTEQAKQRLIKMGEQQQNIFVVGAPGLVLTEKAKINFSKEQLCNELNFDVTKKILLLLFHPVVQEIKFIQQQLQEILVVLEDLNLQTIWLLPNADNGGIFIKNIANTYANRDNFRIIPHLVRDKFLGFMQIADLMLGNSSSGIIEAASFNLPVVNLGNRQNLRERNNNIIDVAEISVDQVASAVNKALNITTEVKQSWQNIYGDGNAASNICNLIKSLPLNLSLMNKQNSY